MAKEGGRRTSSALLLIAVISIGIGVALVGSVFLGSNILNPLNQSTSQTTGISTTTSVSSSFSTLTTSTNSSSSTAELNAITQRIALAVSYQGSTWTLSNETPATVGNALAKLHPTYVSGLIEVNPTKGFTAQEVYDYNTIRNTVLKTDPSAKFDVWLDASQYNTSALIVNEMNYVLTNIHVDIWFFQSYGQAYLSYPSVINASISFAHAHGEYIGGVIFSIKSFPPGSDFAAVEDSNFTFSTKLVSEIKGAYGVPVLAHLNDAPKVPGSSTGEAQLFMDNMTSAQRVQVLRDEAGNQSILGYSYMYGVFFPLYPLSTAYDSLVDGTAFSAIQALMLEYN